MLSRNVGSNGIVFVEDPDRCGGLGVVAMTKATTARREREPQQIVR